MKQTIYEEIQRMKLLSRYDNSKTLSEQGSADINANRVNQQQLSQATPTDSFVQKFYYDGASGGGTDEKDMRDGIATIKSATQFWEKDKLVKTASGMDIAGVINDEFGSNNTWSLQVIVNHLKTIGITSTFNKDSEGNYVEGSFKISTKPVTVAAALPEWTKTFPCLSDRGTMKPTSNPKAVFFTISGDTFFFYDDKSFMYQYASKKQLKGTFDCVNNALLIKTEDGEQWDKVNKWTKTKTATGAAAKKPVATPTELKDANGIKLFQDWLDTNAKGWATGYTEGIINGGKNGGGYGKFGPRTQKAWNNPTYKDGYLKTLQTPAATATEGPKGASYTDEKTGGFYKWNGTEYEFQQSYLASDGIVYTWDGTRYVGAQ